MRSLHRIGEDAKEILDLHLYSAKYVCTIGEARAPITPEKFCNWHRAAVGRDPAPTRYCFALPWRPALLVCARPAMACPHAELVGRQFVANFANCLFPSPTARVSARGRQFLGLLVRGARGDLSASSAPLASPASPGPVARVLVLASSQSPEASLSSDSHVDVLKVCTLAHARRPPFYARNLPSCRPLPRVTFNFIGGVPWPSLRLGPVYALQPNRHIIDLRRRGRAHNAPSLRLLGPLCDARARPALRELVARGATPVAWSVARQPSAKSPPLLRFNGGVLVFACSVNAQHRRSGKSHFCLQRLGFCSHIGSLALANSWLIQTTPSLQDALALLMEGSSSESMPFPLPSASMIFSEASMFGYTVPRPSTTATAPRPPSLPPATPLCEVVPLPSVAPTVPTPGRTHLEWTDITEALLELLEESPEGGPLFEWHATVLHTAVAALRVILLRDRSINRSEVVLRC